jgi:hypothetical protein
VWPRLRFHALGCGEFSKESDNLIRWQRRKVANAGAVAEARADEFAGQASASRDEPRRDDRFQAEADQEANTLGAPHTQQKRDPFGLSEQQPSQNMLSCALQRAQNRALTGSEQPQP